MDDNDRRLLVAKIISQRKRVQGIAFDDPARKAEAKILMALELQLAESSKSPAAIAAGTAERRRKREDWIG